jgi:hypothetical protein
MAAGGAGGRAAAAGALALALVGGPPAGAVEHRLEALLSLRGLATDVERSFLDGGLGKGRFDEGDEAVDLGAAIVDYRAQLLPALAVRAVASAYDSVDHPVDLNELYLEVRPVPRSAWRLQGRLGAFHAPFSLENTDVGWTTPYTVSSSAVNTWLGEELRTLGAEVQATRQGRLAGSPHDLGVVAGAFQGNDPAGALVSWRGWALHDRQTRLFERLPLAPLPALAPGGSFNPPQEAFEEPFREIDNRTGFYVGGQWDWADRSRVRLSRYDNNGDPTVVEDGQWAWDTRFDQAGWHLRLPRGWDVVVQALAGTTEMVGFEGPLVYAHYRARFLLVSHAWGRQRASVRFDDFLVDDQDAIPDDPNDEDGHAWTAAWFLAGERGAQGAWRVGVEALRVSSERAARALVGDPVRRDEDLLQVVAEWRF